MSSLTTNLKLVKPELQDNITPTIFADNFDKIDAALESVSGGALSLEEIEASTNLDGKIPSAAALKEVNNSLIASDGQKLYFDSKDGKYGYNTDPNRGADTFFPFSSVAARGNINKKLKAGESYAQLINFGKVINNPKLTIEMLSHSPTLYCGIIEVHVNDARLKLYNANSSYSQTIDLKWYVYEGDIS